MNNSISQSDYLNKSRNTVITDSCNIMISQLKTKIFELEQNEKSYDLLYSKYKAIQLENSQLTEKSIQLEYQLRQKTESLSKQLLEAKAHNAGLSEELNKKMKTNQALYNANASLSKSVEEKTAEIQVMTESIKEEEMKNKELSENIHSKSIDNQKMLEQISELKNEVSSIKNVIKAKDEMIKAKSDESKTAERNSIDVIGKIKEEIAIANSALSKERKVKSDCEREVSELQVKLKGKTEEALRLATANEDLHHSLKQIGLERIKLLDDIEKYKSHIMVLTQANKEYMDELNEVIIIEDQINSLLRRNDNFLSVLTSNKGSNKMINIKNNQRNGKYNTSTSPIHERNSSFG